ncbi:hypothetical protein N431DRAFT_76480 [Stipitochalara longipes BDJ]|nr:hypothetical protein N431DRAFT_76480 [Stipitochalara longipes BDJ]
MLFSLSLRLGWATFIPISGPLDAFSSSEKVWLSISIVRSSNIFLSTTSLLIVLEGSFFRADLSRSRDFFVLSWCGDRHPTPYHEVKVRC